jgi:acyl-CoA synthetase (AMP-forming)/AMP-acid ligase II
MSSVILFRYSHDVHQNLFPVQIENVLLRHPDIVEAAAISVPDAKYGEVVGAWIVLRDGATLTREDVRAVVARGMNPQVSTVHVLSVPVSQKAHGVQNAPAWVWFTGESQEVPSKLPKTASGKVQKHVLRDNSRVLSQQGFGRVRVETV